MSQIGVPNEDGKKLNIVRSILEKMAQTVFAWPSCKDVK